LQLQHFGNVPPGNEHGVVVDGDERARFEWFRRVRDVAFTSGFEALLPKDDLQSEAEVRIWTDDENLRLICDRVFSHK
jgi:hypothetical protein